MLGRRSGRESSGRGSEEAAAVELHRTAPVTAEPGQGRRGHPSREAEEEEEEEEDEEARRCSCHSNDRVERGR